MPIVPRLVELVPRSKDIIQEPLVNAKFTLDSSGVAGFFGGDSAVSGMATVNLIPNRRWGGWYNTPGSYEIAKQYGQLARSRFWDGLFPGGKHDPAELFGLDGQIGPRFVAIRSGSSFASTGHLAHLITRMARDTESTHTAAGRHTNPATVTIIDLPWDPPQVVECPLSSRLNGSVVFSMIPIAVSWGCCVVCALAGDWYTFAAILTGIVANGWACFVIGSGKLTFKHPVPAAEAPPGDGFLLDGRNIVVLRGTEGAVNSFTQGRFFLQYREPRDEDWQDEPVRGPHRDRFEARDKEFETLLDGGEGSPAIRLADNREEERNPGEGKRESADYLHKVSYAAHEVKDLPSYTTKHPKKTWAAPTDTSWWQYLRKPLYMLLHPTKKFAGFASFLLTVQFLAQLLLIPQGQLFGQLMFVATLAASWAYNSYLSSLDREDIQTTILRTIFELDKGDHVKKYELNSWTATAVFTYLSLQTAHPDSAILHPRKILDVLIPNDTDVWEAWKRAVEAKVSVGKPLEFTRASWDLDYLGEKDRRLLRLLLKDAMVAGRVWADISAS
ncbi:hypothetical protein BD309DRAFT_958688 [Dichomitus squalens]|uniref:Uncharacterized protein n=1 Tax=Dichomitus squalens TaxID=114155 RepID=A0A4V2K4F7_9APHY|nr:hypothetical protein BD309DRAFT_958688 [Dichomitus squalens]TBU65214.1 hypothetical protein BD310DRAFT_914272 [Dichomitus squalens]